ncbi:hypothetical protein [Kitasatospora purpeofusca]|uniref:Uncharacterized protein n=1 Tax=Kitasatospora purpeofusca TaxID=67352 RepID=A0ABZ1TZM7_9ACTN|nr:hypothetical protein [Kitasatospora purpeofusca]
MPPPDRRSGDAATAAACTVLPITLLLALVAWIYPVLKHHHVPRPTPTPVTSTSPTPR